MTDRLDWTVPPARRGLAARVRAARRPALALAGALAVAAIALTAGALLVGAPAASSAAQPGAEGDEGARGEYRLQSSIPGQGDEVGEPAEGEEETLAGAAGAEAQARPQASAAAPSSEDAGHAKYRLDANRHFNRYAHDGAWIDAHVDVIKAYPPYGDVYVQYGKPVIGYHDPATEGYAPLEKSQIEAYVAQVKRDMGVGYAGVFVDDANWSYRPSPGPEANLANLLEAIRKAEPGALIEMNSQYHDIWPKIKEDDPNVARALAQVNLVTKEFGVGPNAMIDTGQEYAEFMQYADYLRAKGIHIVMAGEEHNHSVSTLEFNLATCLLINDGGDYVNGGRTSPRRFWKGFEVNLGSALGARERSSSGLWSRRFSGGVVYAVEPGAATQTIKLGHKMYSAEWGEVESVTLSAQQGAVLSE